MWRLMCVKINTATTICLIYFTQLKDYDLTVFSISTSQAIWRLYEITLSQSLIPNQAPLTTSLSVLVTFLNASVRGRLDCPRSLCILQKWLQRALCKQQHPPIPTLRPVQSPAEISRNLYPLWNTREDIFWQEQQHNHKKWHVFQTRTKGQWKRNKLGLKPVKNNLCFPGLCTV